MTTVQQQESAVTGFASQLPGWLQPMSHLLGHPQIYLERANLCMLHGFSVRFHCQQQSGGDWT